MAICSRCGSYVPDNEAVCSICGQRMPRADKEEYQQDRGYKARPSYNEYYNTSDQTAPSVLWYVGMILLFSIPVVGFIMTVITAAGGGRSRAKRNFAIAYLIFKVIGIGIVAFIGMAISNLVNLIPWDEIEENYEAVTAAIRNAIYFL